MSNNNFTITEESVQGVDSVAMALLSLSQCYELPESVNQMIEELNDRTGSLVNRFHASSNANSLKAVSND